VRSIQEHPLRLRADLTILGEIHSDSIPEGVPIRRHAIEPSAWVREAMSIQGVPLTFSMRISEKQSVHVYRSARWIKSITEALGLSIRRLMVPLLVALFLTALPMTADSQALSASEDSSDGIGTTTAGQLDLTYIPPTQRAKVNNYVFDAFGPYPVVGAAFAAGFNQFTNSPPEWNHGIEGFSKRFGSNFGIEAVSTTTRYGLAQAFREDTLYYRCVCNGLFPRLRHAVISTLTGRQGEDGHRVFSIPGLVAPYAGSMTAVYGWYPSRFEAKDAFRIGSYNLLGDVGANIGLEFFYSGPHSLLSRMHLNNAHGAPDPGPNH